MSFLIDTNCFQRAILNLTPPSLRNFNRGLILSKSIFMITFSLF